MSLNFQGRFCRQPAFVAHPIAEPADRLQQVSDGMTKSPSGEHAGAGLDPLSTPSCEPETTQSLVLHSAAWVGWWYEA